MKTRMVRNSVTGLLAATLMSANVLADDARTQWYGSFTGLRNMPPDSGAELEIRRLGTVGGDIELSDGTGFAIAVGFETGGAQQVELEVAFRPFDIEGANDAHLGSRPIPPELYTLTGDVDTWSLMLNARQLFDIGQVRPYIGGGLGVAHHEGTAALAVAPIPSLLPGGMNGEDSGNDTVVAYQIMAGVEARVGDGARLFAGYRYMGTAAIEIDGLTADYDTHAVEVGVRIPF